MFSGAKQTTYSVQCILKSTGGVSNHWIVIRTGIRTGMEWIGTILKCEIMKYAFSFIVVLHYKMLYFIVLQVVNIVFMS